MTTFREALGLEAWPGDIELSEEAWREIERTLSFSAPSTAVRTEIAEAVWNALAHVPGRSVRNAGVRGAVELLRDAATTLRDGLSIDFEANPVRAKAARLVRPKLAIHRIEDIETYQPEQLPETPTPYDQLISLLNEVIGRADCARERLQDRGGRAPDPVLPPLITDLASIFERATGHRATSSYRDLPDEEEDEYDTCGGYDSPFLNFVEAVVKQAAPGHVREHNALGKLIQRVLKEWRMRLRAGASART